MVEKKSVTAPSKPAGTAAPKTNMKPAITAPTKPEEKKTAPAPPTPTAGKRPSLISTAPKVMKGKKKAEEEPQSLAAELLAANEDGLKQSDDIPASTDEFAYEHSPRSDRALSNDGGMPASPLQSQPQHQEVEISSSPVEERPEEPVHHEPEEV